MIMNLKKMNFMCVDYKSCRNAFIKMYKNLFGVIQKQSFILLLMIFTLYACDKYGPPYADFTVEKSEVQIGEPVVFIDNSTGDDLNEWIWDYGDGNSETFYTSTNPVHSYNAPGTYSVILDVYNDEDNSSTYKEDIITVLPPAYTTGTYTDIRDGKIYSTITINNSTWLAENLKYLPPTGTSTYGTGAYIYDDNPDNIESYGYLYDWEAANTVCPSGWHLSTDEDWQQLELALGMDPVWVTYTGGYSIPAIGGHLKEKDIYFWNFPNTGATNSIGFSARGAGWVSEASQSTKYYNDLGDLTIFWTSSISPSSNSNAYNRSLSANNDEINRNTSFILTGISALSVRCVQD